MVWMDGTVTIATFAVVLIVASVWFGTAKVLRYPLVVTLVLLTVTELLLYFVIRWILFTLEFVVFPTKNKKIRNAQLNYVGEHGFSWESWRENALILDRVDDREEWKSVAQCPLYDWMYIRRLLKDLRSARECGDATLVLSCLQRCLHHNAGGVLNEALYAQTHVGTKHLVEEWVKEVTECIPLTAGNVSSLRSAFGNTALCLSGGGGMGTYHVGVVKALLEQDLLPNLISGTSAGSLIAAHVAVRTDEELAESLTPELYKKMDYGCGMSLWQKLYHFFCRGHVFDPTEWTKLIKWHCKGDTTFAEAYEMTGRVLNITSTPDCDASPQIMLNYITTPDVLIHSAVLASSAVPGLCPKARLLRKEKDGTIEYLTEEAGCCRDGSLKSDLPMDELSYMFNVSYSIVSQVNPHVVPFFFYSKADAGRKIKGLRDRTGGWRGGFLLCVLELLIKADMKKNLSILTQLELHPRIFGFDFSSLFIQNFEGHVTLIPEPTLRDYLMLTSGPTQKDVDRYIRGGKLMVWRKLSLIRTRLGIDKALRMASKS